MEEYIKLLDLPDEFDLDDLKKAYRKKVLQYHPDKAANEAERIGYEATMKKLNEANAYIKEYLENHEGRYSKSEYYNTNSYPDDDTEEDTTEDNTYSDDKTEDESSYEEENEEEYEYDEEAEDTEENAEEKTPFPDISSLSFFDRFLHEAIYGTMLILFPKAIKDDIAKQFQENPTLAKNCKKTAIISFILIIILLFSLIDFDSKDTHTNNNKQTAVQEQVSKEKIPSPNDNKDVVIAKDSPLGKYIAEAQQKVVNNWRLPKGELPESIRVKVAFRIGKDGDVIDYPTVKVSSGSSFVDKSCLRTVINSAPFKPIPEELNKDYLDVELDFEADKKQ